MKQKLKTAGQWFWDRFNYFLAAYFAVYIALINDSTLARIMGVIACLAWASQVFLGRLQEKTAVLRDQIIQTQRETIEFQKRGNETKDRIIGAKDRQIVAAETAMREATDQLKTIRLTELRGDNNV